MTIPVRRHAIRPPAARWPCLRTNAFSVILARAVTKSSHFLIPLNAESKRPGPMFGPFAFPFPPRFELFCY